MSIDVSVVLTVHNEREAVNECIRCIAGQTGINTRSMEIIVVDDRSDDDLEGAIAELGFSSVRFFRIDSPPENRLSSRQRAMDWAFEKARGDVVFLIDADGRAPAHWIEHSLKVMEAAGGDAVAGPVVFRPPPRFIAGLQTVDTHFYLGICRLLNRLGMASGIYFSNFAVRRRVYLELGGNAGIGFALTEDLAFARALHRAGKKMVFQDSCPVEVKASDGWTGLLRRSLRVSAGGLSFLALAIGLWMLSLPVLAACGVVFKNCFILAFATRYFAGVGLNLFFLRNRLRFLWGPTALLCYEPLAILVGLCVATRLSFNRKIRWGGIDYQR